MSRVDYAAYLRSSEWAVAFRYLSRRLDQQMQALATLLRYARREQKGEDGG